MVVADVGKYTRKTGVKCMWRYCHDVLEESTDLYCARHGAKVDDTLADMAKVLSWEAACLFCPTRVEFKMRQDRLNVLIKSGRLRCGTCRRAGVQIERLDLTENRSTKGAVKEVRIPSVRLAS